MDFHTNLFWNSWPLSFFISRPEWVFAWADLTTIDPSVYLKNETNWMHEISNIRSLTWVSSWERKNLAYFNNNWVNNAVKICLEPPFSSVSRNASQNLLHGASFAGKLVPRSKFCFLILLHRWIVLVTGIIYTISRIFWRTISIKCLNGALLSLSCKIVKKMVTGSYSAHLYPLLGL